MNASVELGKIVGTHAVRGEVRAENWAEPALWQGLKTVCAAGREWPLLAFRPHKNFMLLTLQGVETVEQAMALRGAVITVPRSQIRLPAGRFLYQDLYGFSVFDLRTNTVIGTLKEVQETPASVLYVVDVGNREVLIPAVPAFDRGADFDARILRVETIEGMIE